jgi:hypothetical protein
MRGGANIVRGLCLWLTKASKVAWVPILLVSLTSLWFVIANYRLQLNANRPELTSSGGNINLSVHPETLVVNWGNIGKKSAQRGIASLITISEDGKRRKKLGVAEITGAGSNVVPNYNGQATFSIDMQGFLGRFLVCTEYFDDSGAKYQQVFLFRLYEQQNGSPLTGLEELALPDHWSCQ